jgi:hypothetical protein
MKRLRILPFLVALVLLVAGCGVSGGQAASVNGETISTGAIHDELDAIQGNVRYRQLVQIPRITGETQGTFNSAVVAQLLTRQIVFHLIENELDRRNVSLSPDQLQAAKIAYYRALGNGDVNAGKEVFQTFPADYQEQLARWNGEVLLLQNTLAGLPASAMDDPNAYFDAHPEAYQKMQQKFGAWLDRTLRNAKVDVNSRYGSWDGKLGKVDPPQGPTEPATDQPGGATSSTNPSGG